MTREPGNLPRPDRPEASREKELQSRPVAAADTSSLPRRLAMRRLFFSCRAPVRRLRAQPGRRARRVRADLGRRAPAPRSCCPDGPAGPRTVVTGPEAAIARRPGPRGLPPSPSTQPGFVLDPAVTADVAEGETSLDLTVAPAPVRERVVVAATRDEAAVVHSGDLRRASWTASASRSARPPTCSAAAGGARRGRRAHRRVGLQGSVFVRGGDRTPRASSSTASP